MADDYKIRDTNFHLYDTKDFYESLSDYKLRDSIFHNRLPTKLKKTFYISILLVILGLGLLIAGVIIAINTNNIQESFSYWILSIICLIPGVYYSVQFLRAKREQNEDYRREILDEIPTL